MAEQAPRKIKIACPGCGQKLDVSELEPFSRVKCPACSFDLIVPKWFGNYLLESPEGAGGMATVYRALDLALDREVAIKIFDPGLAAQGVSSGIFLHEARIAATVNHPAVVPIYSCGEMNGSAYIVMQYMGGGTLESRLRKAKGRLPVMETCRWVRDVCEGLDAAREHGVIHHDVKPANIMLDLDSNAKISDFGLSQAVSGKSASAFLDPSKMWLSPQYVSPEKVLTGEEGPEGDVYSLGASFYHLLTGEPPFQADNMQELVSMRTQRDPVPPDLVRPDITRALSSVILDMMSRDPAARPSYKQVVTRINDALRAIMRPAQSVPAEEAGKQMPSRKVLNVPAGRVDPSKKHSFRSSHVTLLLILLFLMSGICFLVFLPRFVGQRSLLDAAPSLKAIYGDLPAESFPFLTDSFYESPLIDAEFAFADHDYPLEARYAAAWVSAVCQMLDAAPSAVDSAADMGDHLRSAASLAGKHPPRADAYCLAVLSRLDPNPPDVYFSAEQRVRMLMGRLVRSLYDLDPDSLENGRVPDSIMNQFGSLRTAFQDLPDGSWLAKLFGSRLSGWHAALSGDSATTTELEPLFRRLSGKSAQKRPGNILPAPSGTHDAPFGVTSRTTPPDDGKVGF
ncbi:MAG: serine/threonine protein kinase [Lentisphaeria bacterium]|nr:serine/threonine protein kinase [Lentisphaeria bacterium]MBR3505877.1 serine/threonine protein kinase [Lentisphaeria bacterium]